MIALLPAMLAGCDRRAQEAEPRNPPDTVLQDSLGLADDDRVHRVDLAVEAGVFVVEPESLTVGRGVWVEFVTADGWPRTLRFELDSLPAAAMELFRSTGQAASPPLVEPGARFVVSFAGAPSGRYPFLVEGSGRSARGVVIVDEPEPGR